MTAIVTLLLSPLGRIVGIIALIVAAWLGINWWGDAREAAGAAKERAAWEAAAQAERERQASVKQATEALGAQIVAQLGARMEGLERELKDLSDVAAAEDAKPVPDACRDVYRGLAPDVLRRLEGIR